MSILSLEFLAFSALVILLYYLLPLGKRWLGLLAASAVYLSLAGWQSIAHLSAVALVMWGGGWLCIGQKASCFWPCCSFWIWGP